ncbi:nucleolar protein 58 [Microbotryum lychnidis-dioicae p1A1 Lamole]|uniref:Nucleolar protein 58 n=1 Tax=Microbotryum lychnidis-dioicae (strain p1A1 Lamole / MvSl-1064) TaxID=683840 RepID=U5H9U3_USTV1|nr:nucleolar protein 58 [Microbotryum lychnidis-dioicae p1A1 Lamole]|eukprot:KDE05609.1 nucleolar protein 58 [Microbotryum lychnidis-dioicae p1A1 Lamole]
MLVLFESSVGLALFKIKDGKLDDKQLYKQFDDPESASNLVKLQAIHRYTSTASAVEDMTSIGEGKVSKALKKFLTDEITGNKKLKSEKLAVAEPKLAGAIAKKLELSVISDSTVNDLYRGIRQQLSTLLGDIDPKDLSTMELGLSHSVSRYKLKFSPDKVDTMIVQAIALLDDLDKEINIYSMRVKEWYGWHFPEMGKIVSENITYAKVVKAMGFRTNYNTTDFSAILPEELEETLKSAAAISMGTEISDTDLNHILLLADQVISITQYRSELFDYLRNRMAAIAPNLTALVGELVGARLIAHAGSLLSLAKHPASTVQILGAEKALFRALKTKHDTPKYGLIFHASLVGQAPQKLKGKMARMVATKAALSIRLDALADADSKSSLDSATIGFDNRVKLEARLRLLEQGIGHTSLRSLSKTGAQQSKFEMKGNGAKYNDAADTLLLPTATATGPMEMAVDEKVLLKEDERVVKGEEDEEAKKERKRLKKEAKKAAKEGKANGDAAEDEEKKEKDKKKKRKAEDDGEVEEGEKSKKKKKDKKAKE